MKKKMKWVNAAAFAVMLLMNALANLLPLGGRTTGEVSAAYPNLFSPAPVTFSIWGLIYLLLLGFVLYQFGYFDKGACSSAMRAQIGWLFAVSCLLNTLWILCWHLDEIGLSLVCMVLLLLCLAMIEMKVRNNRGPAVSRLYVNAGFDIYFGWIIAASIANVSVLLVKLGWNGFGLPEQFWTVLVIFAGAGIASAVIEISKIRLAGLAVVWAYIGIIIRHLSKDGFDGKYPSVIAAAIIGILIILFFIVRFSFREVVFGYLPEGKAGQREESPDAAGKS